jgi:shikimate kinase
MTPPAVNLYLVGFMGTGKSTVGRQVARQMGFRFLDSDHEIERAQGKPVAQIFATEGETRFRALERDFIENGHPAEGCVVACGGGLIVPPGMLELLRHRGVVICLHAPIETILLRTLRTNHRPLLRVENPERRVRELYAQREEIYRRTGTVVLTDNRPQREIAAHVMRVYRFEAAHFKK